MKKELIATGYILVFVGGILVGHVGISKAISNNYITKENTDDKENINSFVSSFCNKKKFGVHITKGKFRKTSNDFDQYFVYCDVPFNIPIPSLYIIERRFPSWGGFSIVWSAKHSDRAREVGDPEIVDVNNNGLSEIYWGGYRWGGMCAPWSSSGHLYAAEYGREYSIERKYEFDKECEYSAVFKETILKPDPSSYNDHVIPIYDFLEDKVPMVS